MKTIQDLNKKIWYRTIKVFYIFMSVIILWISSFVVYDIFYSAQVQQKVQADINNSNSKKWDRNTFVQKIKKYSTQYNVSSSEAYDFLLDQANKQGYIIEWVNDSPEQVKSQVRWENIELDIRGDSIIWFKMLWLGIIWYLLFFQIFNRAFYYIVLWTLFPKKD